MKQVAPEAEIRTAIQQFGRNQTKTEHSAKHDRQPRDSFGETGHFQENLSARPSASGSLLSAISTMSTIAQIPQPPSVINFTMPRPV